MLLSPTLSLLVPCGCRWCPAHIAPTPPGSTVPSQPLPLCWCQQVSEAPAHRENRTCPQGLIPHGLWPSTEPAVPSEGRLRWGGQRPQFTGNLSFAWLLTSSLLLLPLPHTFLLGSFLTESLELKSLIQGLFLGEPNFSSPHNSFTRNARKVKMWPRPSPGSLQWALACSLPPVAFAAGRHGPWPTFPASSVTPPPTFFWAVQQCPHASPCHLLGVWWPCGL